MFNRKRKWFNLKKKVLHTLTFFLVMSYSSAVMLFFKVLNVFSLFSYLLFYIPRAILIFTFEILSIIFYKFIGIFLKFINYKSAVEIYVHKQLGSLHLLGNIIWQFLFSLGVFFLVVLYIWVSAPIFIFLYLHFFHDFALIAYAMIFYFWVPFIFLAIISDYGEKYIMKLKSWFCVTNI